MTKQRQDSGRGERKRHLWDRLRNRFPVGWRRGYRSQPGGLVGKRIVFVERAVWLVLAIIAVRAIFLHIFPTADEVLSHIATGQYQREVELAPYRGAILDRRGEGLALSIRKPSLAINPRVFAPTRRDLRALARILGKRERDLRRLAEKPRFFAWLARQVSHKTAARVLSMELNGIYEISEPARYYPAGEAAAHIIGKVGIDSQGLMGLELRYDRDLRGQPQVVMQTKDAHAKTIFRRAQGARPEKAGHSLHLTLDRVLQEIAEEALKNGIKAAGSRKGYAVVTDPHTGRILAFANYPGFNPNDSQMDPRRMRNHALLDAVEPGSVTKPFIVAKALEWQAVGLHEKFDCGDGVLKIGRNRIRDTHKAKRLSTERTLIESSNICTYRIANRLGRERTFGSLYQFGIGAGEAKLDFPGSATGRIDPWESWREIRFANIAFGQGLLTTALELSMAMGAIANGGLYFKPTLIDRIVSSAGLVVSADPIQRPRRVLPPAIARTMARTLHRVTSDPEGTGKLATPHSYTAAGKTGTAQKVEPGIKGYAKDKYLVSFLGFAPLSDPHLVIYVAIDEPTNQPYYGGTWAAPVFARIAEQGLKYLNVMPDAKRRAEGPDQRGGREKHF